MGPRFKASERYQQLARAGYTMVARVIGLASKPQLRLALRPPVARLSQERSAWVEQKNSGIVRRLVVYRWLEGRRAWLGHRSWWRLFANAQLHTNLFRRRQLGRYLESLVEIPNGFY